MNSTGPDVLPGGIREMARRLGIGERQAYREAARGKLPAIQIGGRWVVPIAAWERFLNGEWSRESELEAEPSTS